jgi:glycerate dehydrogenase
MKIVILDGYTLNPGDLAWSEIEECGKVTVYEYTPAELIYERAKGADILFTNKTPLNSEMLGRLEGLKYIGVLATGYNVVDVETAKRLGITVTNIPTYGTYSVAQMVFAHLLEHCHNVGLHSSLVKRGEWAEKRDFCFWEVPLVELYGKKMGIIGFGRIGRQVAAIADAIGMDIIAADKYKSDVSGIKSFKWAETEELLRESDVVSLHCPLFPDTKGIINKETLALMKSSAFLINTSRGGLIVDKDLADALNNGKIAGAGIDVISTEPPSADNPLLKAKNCNITPHIAWATKEARTRLMNIAAENLKAFLAGKPANVINK